MNWNKDKSIVLSKICTVGFALLLTAIVVCCLVALTCTPPGMPPEARPDIWFGFVITSGAVPVYIALWQLYKMLRGIGRGAVFVAENVRCLRIISWCCFAVALVFLLGSIWGGSWVIYLACAAAAFGGLILRVVKNVFAAAVELKADSDLTI